MQHKEITLDGQRLTYYESGGRGRPVLFVHGNSMSGLSFERQFAAPLGEKYRLVALDLPGHGESGPAADPNSAYALPGYARVVCGFVKALAIDDAVLVGWSLGGHILLEASGQLPESAGLMIFGTPPVGKPLAADAFIPTPLFPLAFKSDLSDEETSALTASFFRPGSEIPRFFCHDMRRTDGRARESLGASVALGNYADEVRIAGDYRKPLALIHGEHDQLVNLAYLKALDIPALWRGGVQVIAAAGHAPQWEQAEQFNRLLAEFINDCDC